MALIVSATLHLERALQDIEDFHRRLPGWMLSSYGEPYNLYQYRGPNTPPASFQYVETERTHGIPLTRNGGDLFLTRWTDRECPGEAPAHVRFPIKRLFELADALPLAKVWRAPPIPFLVLQC